MAIPKSKMNEQRWQKLAATVHANRIEQLGLTVSEAAAELGISRQAVHKAIKRGHLGAVTVRDYDGQPRMCFIPGEQVLAYKAKRPVRLAG